MFTSQLDIYITGCFVPGLSKDAVKSGFILDFKSAEVSDGGEVCDHPILLRVCSKAHLHERS